MKLYEPKPPERPASECRAVKYKGGDEITITLPIIGDRSWNEKNRKLVDATDWPEIVMDIFRDNTNWQIIDGYKTAETGN
jgi:hypothetical protein